MKSKFVVLYCVYVDPSGCWSTAPHAVLTLMREGNITVVYICICCVGWCIDACCWFTQNSFPL